MAQSLGRLAPARSLKTEQINGMMHHKRYSSPHVVSRHVCPPISVEEGLIGQLLPPTRAQPEDAGKKISVASTSEETHRDLHCFTP